MWNRKDLKEKGKAAFKKNYWACVIVSAVLTLLIGGGASSAWKENSSDISQKLGNLTPEEAAAVLIICVSALALFFVIGILVKMFIVNPLIVGAHRFFVRNSQEDGKVSAKLLFSAFRDGRFGKVFATMFLTDLFTVLWSLLFLIPGIVKAYSYRMVPYILTENPDMSATEIITMSREMMNGQKWKAFVLDLSFIGWWFLAAITCGLAGVFYTAPYVQATNAELYLALKEEY